MMNNPSDLERLEHSIRHVLETNKSADARHLLHLIADELAQMKQPTGGPIFKWVPA